MLISTPSDSWSLRCVRLLRNRASVLSRLAFGIFLLLSFLDGQLASQTTQASRTESEAFDEAIRAVRQAEAGDTHAMLLMGIADVTRARGRVRVCYWWNEKVLDVPLSAEDRKIVNALILLRRCAATLDSGLMFFRKAAERGNQAAAMALVSIELAGLGPKASHEASCRPRWTMQHSGDAARLRPAVERAIELGSLQAEKLWLTTAAMTRLEAYDNASLDALEALWRRGLASVALEIGQHYWHGSREVSQDREVAVAWWNRGARAGATACMVELGRRLLEEGQIQAAEASFQEARRHGSIEGALEAGHLLWARGRYRRAASCYREAAEMDLSSEALAWLARCYWEGRGLPADRAHGWVLLHSLDPGSPLFQETLVEWACRTCQGSGWLRIPKGNGEREGDIQQTCPTCHGRGYSTS